MSKETSEERKTLTRTDVDELLSMLTRIKERATFALEDGHASGVLKKNAKDRLNAGAWSLRGALEDIKTWAAL